MSCFWRRPIEIAREIVRCDALDRVVIGLDFFDASINRIAAWAVGMRNMQKALLSALLMPHAALKRMQDEGRFTEQMAMQEELKTYPLGDVWDHFCETQGVPVGALGWTSWRSIPQKEFRSVCEPGNRTALRHFGGREGGRKMRNYFWALTTAPLPARRLATKTGRRSRWCLTRPAF